MSPNPFSARWPLYLAVTLGLVIIFGYALFAASPYLLGPTLTVAAPQDGATLTTPTVIVSGKTARVSYLTVNDLAVPLLEDGTFALERAYPPGYTVVTVRARDRFGRETVRTVRFLHTTNLPQHAPEEKSTSSRSY